MAPRSEYGAIPWSPDLGAWLMLSIPLLLVPLALAGADDQSDDEDAPLEVLAESERVRQSASERHLDRTELRALPGRSAEDVLRALPGLHLSTHGGRGKASQFLLRGFDAVHGSDLAVDVDGVPLNEPSNSHAHGYLDLHVLPRVLLDRAELRPGTFSPSIGDFAVAGSTSLHLGLAEPGGWAGVGAGTDRSAQATLAWRPRQAPAGTFLLAWSGWRRLELMQNFTGAYDNAEHGDGTRQDYRAISGGVRARADWLLSPDWTARGGLDARLDALTQQELAVESDGAVWKRQDPSSARPASLGSWVALAGRAWSWLRVEPGLRAQVVWIDRPDAPSAWAPVLAPKLSTTWFEDAPVAAFASYGRGFRSPDVRGLGDGGRAPIALVDSVEVGLRTPSPQPVELRLATSATWVDDEIVNALADVNREH